MKELSKQSIYFIYSFVAPGWYAWIVAGVYRRWLPRNQCLVVWRPGWARRALGVTFCMVNIEVDYFKIQKVMCVLLAGEDSLQDTLTDQRICTTWNGGMNTVMRGQSSCMRATTWLASSVNLCFWKVATSFEHHVIVLVGASYIWHPICASFITKCSSCKFLSILSC